MIYIPKHYGTCNGAQKALDLVYQLYEREIKKNKPKRIVIYKEILHNNRVIEDLKDKNIMCVDKLTDVNKDDIVVIRAHGEGKNTYDYFENKKIEYYDATCPNVLHIHDIIKEKYYQNYDIIIVGKKNKDGSFHPEVEGSNGWCQNNAKIISNLEDINNLNIKSDNVLIICQTTYNEDLTKIIVKKIKEKFKNKNIEFVNSICNAQKLIQKSALEIAKKCDYMIVIGGKNSSNTNELYKVCESICNSVKVSNLTELYEWLISIDIDYNTNIGITGGASTPKTEINEYKQLIEFYLFYKQEKNIFEQEINNYNSSFLNFNENKIVNDALQKFTTLNQDGKYLRAMLISLGYKIFSEKNDNIYIPLALAYETFQTAILIHDDIIDNASKRRGKDTIPELYKKEFSCQNKKIGNIVANSLGICIGDLGFYLANKIIIENYNKNANICKIIDYYNEIVIKTIKGEIIDVKLPYNLQYENCNQCSENNIMEIYRLKTAWYTIIGPFCLGALLSNNSNINIKQYEEILEDIGIAFQIKDDIIGIFGDSKYIGKSTNSDISEFKQTILYSYVFNQKLEYLSELNKYYGKNNLKEEEIERVKEIFIASGALEYANTVMNKLFDKSVMKIKNININEEYKDIILGFINYLRIRQK